QATVVAIDAKRVGDRWRVFIYGGREDTGLDVVDYAVDAVKHGAGEILPTSMDREGATSGCAVELLKAVPSAVGVPVIASGGAGNAQHTIAAVQQGGADAVMAASIFHFGELSVGQVKAAMSADGVPGRRTEHAARAV